MKKAIVLLTFLILFALMMAAGSVRSTLAQSSQSGISSDMKDPVSAQPAEGQTDTKAGHVQTMPVDPGTTRAVETKTESYPQATTPPAADAEMKSAASPSAPAAPAWKPSPEPATTAGTGTTNTESSKKSFMVRLSHKEFATMSLKECADCHKGSGVAPTHGSDQMREHVSIARRNGKNCVDCHTQQFCLDCHKGGGIDADLRTDNYRHDYVPNSHRTDFREIHPIKALDNPQTCYRCHDSRFCSTCHAKFRGEDLMVQSHRRQWSDLQAGTAGPAHSSFTTAQCQTCHPNGLLPKHQWSADHAREARRNLQACQTCHSDGDICMTCHSARTGLMVNPHPRNWDSVKAKYRSRSDGKACVKCHDRF